MRDPYLQAMGIEQWVRRKPHPQAVAAAEDKPAIAEHAVADSKDHATEHVGQPETQSYEIELTPPRSGQTHDIDRLDWPELKSRVVSCTLCDLHATRINAVFGSGDHHADWMLIGEAPGAEEDKQGEPFVGRAGELLTAMLQAMKLKQEQVFITNIVKCRPPDNREPHVDEVQSCQPYLRRQIELLQPKLILAIGHVAAKSLLGRAEPMKDLRGQRFEYADTGIPVVVTYHPAYLLRKPGEKRKAWQDLQFAMRLFAEQAGIS
ncbi:uracil-DNA glycosylase family protein [Sulfuriflexus sp.]|uniref:uracil-DNA glycosylase family protein n=1 Tax=Sulfuriflexus sp. TaxID=2015443 RepID=UPI0028CD58D9|nr:uracil-DNA glycosylase family protein [Sulfuriflexus sp.]MDT8403613.1 uracil-DNA glycosylase family protein [Sulfuriflexus sp.]